MIPFYIPSSCFKVPVSKELFKIPMKTAIKARTIRIILIIVKNPINYRLFWHFMNSPRNREIKHLNYI